MAAPQLVRSRSGSAPAIAITANDRSSRRSSFSSSSERFISGNNRSKSTSSRSSRTAQSSSGATSPGMMKKVPSAWAMSPGRSALGSQFIAKVSESPAKANGGGGRRSVTSKVLNYLKQRKSSPIEEEGYHRFKILHNRLLQWRFINARAQFAMARIKTVAEMQLFSVWLRTLRIRKAIIQKKTELQNVKHLIKLYQIVIPQLPFLNEWAKLERRNQESVERLERKLVALSNTLPLSNYLKVDTVSVSEVLNTAIDVMDHLEPLIMKFQAQVERILYQVTELITTSKQEEEYLQDLMEVVPMITTLMEKEKSIQVYLMQKMMEPNIGIWKNLKIM
ncbi:QWRF motif-containing protein 7-like [Arachis stenosperma]|uniref:QWRF motif-containing protein 7-like n=1 Tax=Arachis stenosperma TaxID=217475 RepID=UPI0025AD0C93|nr:QWRF motif-containing protein 7-like [Arachis stenosperma]